MFERFKMDQKGYPKRPTVSQKGTKREPPWAKEPPKTSSGEQGRTNDEQKYLRLTRLRSFFNQDPSKSDPPNHQTNDCEKTWNVIGDKTDANNYQKLMPTLVTKQIINIIKHHVFWIVKSCEFIAKTTIVDGLESCARERNRYQTLIKHGTQIHPVIDEKTLLNRCSKEWCGTYRISSNMYSRRESPIIKNTFQTLSRNLIRSVSSYVSSSFFCGWGGGHAAPAKQKALVLLVNVNSKLKN